jgi:hypothetical protein
MTTLLIHAELMPLTVELPAQMSPSLEQFHELCRANPDLRIERSATGVVMIMPPTFSDMDVYRRVGDSLAEQYCPVQMLENPETLSSDPELSGFTLRLEKIW